MRDVANYVMLAVNDGEGSDSLVMHQLEGFSERTVATRSDVMKD
jgi:hypothetical protein